MMAGAVAVTAALLVLGLSSAAAATAEGFATAADDGPPPPLQLVARWPLGHAIVGRIDHLAFQPAAGPIPGQLVVNALEANLTLVLNTGSGALLQTLAGAPPLQNPQGAGFAPPPLSRLAVADTLDGKVHLFDTSQLGDYREVGSVSLGVDADNVRWDAQSAHLLVGYGDKSRRGSGSALLLPPSGVAEIDPRTGAIVAVTTLPVHAESFQLSGLSAGAGSAGRRLLYVNTPDANASIQVVDRDQQRVIATWNVIRPTGFRKTHIQGNYPMALLQSADGSEEFMLVGCREPPTLALLSCRNGSTLSVLAAVGETDDVWWDTSAQRVYMTGQMGRLDVFEVDLATATLSRLASLPTRKGARTSLWDALSRRLFVAVPKEGPLDAVAAIWVYAAVSADGGRVKTDDDVSAEPPAVVIFTFADFMSLLLRCCRLRAQVRYPYTIHSSTY